MKFLEFKGFGDAENAAFESLKRGDVGNYHPETEEGINFFIFEFDENQPFLNKNLEYSIGQLLWNDNQPIMRMKGLIFCSNQEKKCYLQGVEDVFEVEPSNVFWRDSEKKYSKFLFIGKGLDKDLIKRRLEECLTLNN